MKFEHICLGAFTACLCFFTAEAGLFVRREKIETAKLIVQLKTDEHAEAIKLDDILTDTSRTLRIVAGTATHVEKMSRTWQTQQNRLAGSTLAAMSTLNASLLQLNTLESTATSLLDSQGKSLTQLEGTASKSIETATSSVAKFQEPALAFLTNLSQGTASLNSDILELKPAIQNANDAAKHMDAVADDSQKISDHYTQIILHPVKTAWGKIYHAWQIAVGSAQIATAVK